MLTRFVIDRFKTRAYPPSGVWRDFDFDYRWWLYLSDLAKCGHFPLEELYPEPQPSDYTDYESPKTRE